MPDASAARALWLDDEEELRPESELHAIDEMADDPSLEWLRDPEKRRTVRITGQPMRAQRRRIDPASATSDYPARRRRTVTEQRIRTRPDRIALWAFLLGLFLVFMAVATANASPL